MVDTTSRTGAEASAGATVPPTAPADFTPAQIAREAITALISLVILGVAMWAFVSTFLDGGAVFTGGDAAAREAAYQRQKDLLVIAIGLLGTVTGYYLGRVPAELRAQTAQNLVTDATAATAQANRTMEQVKKDARAAAEAALRALQRHAAALTGEERRSPLEGVAGSERARTGIDEAQAHLEQMLRRF